MKTGRQAHLSFAPAQVIVEDLPGGGFILRSPMNLKPYAGNICSYLAHWAGRAPERSFLAERDPAGGWQRVSYSETLHKVRAIGQALLDRDVTVDRPVMILSDNSIENALLQLGAMYVGFPVTLISPAYSLMSKDFGKLKYVFDLARPGLVFADNAERFRAALAALDLSDVLLVAKQNFIPELDVTGFSELTNTKATTAVEAAFSKVGPGTVAKILFTSGSTGEPKGVINTHRMLCSNQQAIVQIWPFITRCPPVLVDWLPWNHTFGGNHNFNMILRNGGTLYIDSGRPVPGSIETTINNLRAVAPTLYFNVPRGFQMILPYLEEDEQLRDHFFSNLETIFYAAAALPQDLWDRLEDLSLAARGEKVAMTSAWGLTETAPLATGVHFLVERAGVIGLPVPEMELKMVPNHGRLEMRVRGPNVTPGYYKRNDLTREAFDEDGFFLTGDAGKLVDPDDPAKGILFDGRVAENFKLLTGSWVNTGAVRIAAISAGTPIIQDAVVAGHDRDEIGLLVFPNFSACAEIAGLQPDTPPSKLVGLEKVRNVLRKSLAAYNAENQGSSMAIMRVLLMVEPPDIDAGEITDKGYINQHAVLQRRHGLVDKLYSGDSRVILVKASSR
ncbi:MAG: feruloyl-CoA synthase [Gammaproteobacteria bacterium]|nr:feruloyl-CoA synthase [Gammaproteobacteria bacterium]